VLQLRKAGARRREEGSRAKSTDFDLRQALGFVNVDKAKLEF